MLHTPRIITLSGPSGVGKTTVAWVLEQRGFTPTISSTTRPPRPGERHGKDYFFVSEEEFYRRKREGEFFEIKELYGGYKYGTPLQTLQDATPEKPVVHVVDVTGARKLKDTWNTEVLAVFLLPPSLEALRIRLGKQQRPRATLQERLSATQREIDSATECDIQVVNDSLVRVTREVLSYIRPLHIWNQEQDWER